MITNKAIVTDGVAVINKVIVTNGVRRMYVYEPYE